MRLNSIAVGIGVTLGWVAVATASATASTVYSGANYSYTTNNNSQAVICDQEADGDTAYVKGAQGTGATFRIDDLDGSSGGCWKNTTPFPSNVQLHITCQDWNNRPDPCGPTSYHF